IRYAGSVERTVLTEAREAAGLSKAALAARAHTSRSTLSAYEHGRISPTLDTVERILAAAGHRLTSTRVLRWHEVAVGRGRTASVPDRLPDLPTPEALRTFALPLHLDWSRPGRTVRLADRRERARVYEVVLREGTPADIESIVDGALLVDLWDELVLPRGVRSAWQPLIDQVVGSDG
ncbi:MAG: helix-turn-helix domain-containing protein, partial [Solirubrobacterales bacterium]